MEVATGKIVSHINLSYNVEKDMYTFDPDELQVIREELKRKSKTPKRTSASNLEPSIDLDFGTVRTVVEPSQPIRGKNLYILSFLSLLGLYPEISPGL